MNNQSKTTQRSEGNMRKLCKITLLIGTLVSSLMADYYVVIEADRDIKGQKSKTFFIIESNSLKECIIAHQDPVILKSAKQYGSIVEISCWNNKDIDDFKLHEKE